VLAGDQTTWFNHFVGNISVTIGTKICRSNVCESLVTVTQLIRTANQCSNAAVVGSNRSLHAPVMLGLGLSLPVTEVTLGLGFGLVWFGKSPAGVFQGLGWCCCFALPPFVR